MDDEIKQAMQMSLNEYVIQLKSELKKEPGENDPECCLIIFKYNDFTYERRFSSDDKIADLKLFVKYSIQTFSEVELSENFPRKIFEKDFSTLKAEGISKRQILWVKLK